MVGLGGEFAIEAEEALLVRGKGLFVIPISKKFRG